MRTFVFYPKVERALLILTALFLVPAVALAFQADTTTVVNVFTEKEVTALKELAGWKMQYGIIAIIITAVVLIFGILGLRKWVGAWAEEKAMAKIANKLDVKAEVLEASMKRMIKDHNNRQKLITVVSAQKDPNTIFKEYLDEAGFGNLDYISLDELAGYDGTQTKLFLFNYPDLDPEKEPIPFEEQLLKMKDSGRFMLFVKGRVPNSLIKELGNRLNFSNGYNTLDQRIVEAFKQPL